MGMDIFMDVGTVSPESVNAAMQASKTSGIPTVEFNVHHRFALTLQTAMLINQRLTELIKRSIEQAQENVEPEKKGAR